MRSRCAAWRTTIRRRRKILRELQLITSKPVLYVANVGEDDLAGTSAMVRKGARSGRPPRGARSCRSARGWRRRSPSSKSRTDRKCSRAWGSTEPALAVLARAAYRLLGLQSYYTAGPKEIRAWTIPIGATAPQAAGVIHSDFERGFIRVEVYSVDELVQYGSEKAIREAGKMRLEGKSYVMQDSDVCHFLFNV